MGVRPSVSRPRCHTSTFAHRVPRNFTSYHQANLHGRPFLHRSLTCRVSSTDRITSRAIRRLHMISMDVRTRHRNRATYFTLTATRNIRRNLGNGPNIRHIRHPNANQIRQARTPHDRFFGRFNRIIFSPRGTQVINASLSHLLNSSKFLQLSRHRIMTTIKDSLRNFGCQGGIKHRPVYDRRIITHPNGLFTPPITIRQRRTLTRFQIIRRQFTSNTNRPVTRVNNKSSLRIAKRRRLFSRRTKKRLSFHGLHALRFSRVRTQLAQLTVDTVGGHRTTLFRGSSRHTIRIFKVTRPSSPRIQVMRIVHTILAIPNSDSRRQVIIKIRRRHTNTNTQHRRVRRLPSNKTHRRTTSVILLRAIRLVGNLRRHIQVTLFEHRSTRRGAFTRHNSNHITLNGNNHRHRRRQVTTPPSNITRAVRRRVLERRLNNPNVGPIRRFPNARRRLLAGLIPHSLLCAHHDNTPLVRTREAFSHIFLRRRHHFTTLHQTPTY